MESLGEKRLTAEWLRYGVVNYAMQQNFVPIVRNIAITNHSSSNLHQVTVTMKSEPEIATEWSKTVDVVPAGQTVEIGTVDMNLSGTYLAGLTERLTGKLTLEVTQDGNVLYRDSSPLTVLAYDQWAGLAEMPEMIAAFMMPNHPVITQILSEAASYLHKWTGSPSFDAYQSKNPNRVRHQAAAIYSAIQAHQPTYCVAPASFEEIGQRVRLPDAIIGNRMGNCLDLTLLYAACLEAAGLYPLVIFTKEHAFPGVWLIQETFSESVQDDLSLLTKRLASGVHEIGIVEATLMCAGSHSPYQEAEAAAMPHLADPDHFVGFIDIRRARSSAIRPLPIRVPTPNGWEIVQANNEAGPASEAPPEEVTIHERPAEVSSISVTKQKQWERKLLDLSLRNTLLNLRLTKSALPLLNDRLSELEDALADGQEFQLFPKPSDWENTLRSADLFRSIGKDHPLNTLIQQEFLQKRLRTDVNDRELAEKAIHLYRTARLSLEENGANTLYLSLGLLKWYESAVSEMPRYAPIVLVPVELVRKSSSAGFVLRARDEEPQINITLLEMLRQDFGKQIGGLDPLPRDEKGIDLAGIFSTIRHVIMNLPRWDVAETAILGSFSFSRFVMWNDIRSRAGDLAKNKVVASLMSGHLEWEPGEIFPDAERLDELFPPDELLLPISADSSQITAVSAASQGNSFVLHGPPGTGKSQTITNIIASSLANGKTVLFVAEKMAALSVVQSRLEQIGLGPFCLELHSNKSTKKSVLEQLRRTLETARSASPEEWKRQADRLAVTRKELNGFVASLHKPYSFGASLYEAIIRYGRVQSALPVVRFDTSTIGKMTVEGHTQWVDLVRELAVAGETAMHPSGNVWADVRTSSYTPAMRSQAEDLLSSYRATLAKLQAAYGSMNDWLAFSSEQPTSSELQQIEAVIVLLHELPSFVPTGLLSAPDLEYASAQVVRAVQLGRSRNEARSGIENRFLKEMLHYEAASALSEWRKADLQWFLPKLLKQNRIHKAIKSMTIPGVSLPKTEVTQALSLVVQFQNDAQELQKTETALLPLLGAAWNQGEADWEAVYAAQEWILRLHNALFPLFKEASLARKARERFADLFAAGKDSFQERCGSAVAQFVSAQQERRRLEGQLSDLLRIDFEAMDEKREGKPWFDYRDGKAQLWLGNMGSLRDWCSWRLARERAAEAGLEPVIKAYESGQLQHADVVPAFERGWWKTVIQYILESDQQLASFSGRLFEEKIKVFQETAERFEKLTRQEIAARLAANIPPLHNQAAASSEAGFLLRAIRSGGRGMSLRKLFEQIPNLLNRLCPCALMSPMSVAQYLDPKYAPFDLVVFDEASQLPTSEAVGAMARGRNVIVVGDPKQLPPTSFFASTGSDQTDDADAAVLEDLESILDDCLALGMPQEHLLWHYRSRHESLIAFSNRHFYENKLLTFPSPLERTSNVIWHPVDGYYDRGKTKQNRAEAELVVKEITRRLQDAELRKRSMGVVTFNSIQQTLIEDLLDDAFRQNPGLEEIASQLFEPIFIKNLENVQGDERDVILFSIGYGPDASGKVVLNFGPLNREGGWRRLNVAVSRARYEMHVFSALRADHLDVSRTRAQGVSALKSFLEYAERGKSALGIAAGQADLRAEGIEGHISAALADKGFKADLHVGASGYRMDMAIVHPDKPDTYVLAVLCDGNGYKTGKTARDREMLREQVLAQLGWNIHRVWSIDWLENPEREIERILASVKTAMQAKAPAARTEVPQASLERLSPASKPNEQAAEPTAHLVWRSAYVPVTLQEAAFPSEEFYSTQHEKLVRSQIAQVIKGEGPISRSLLGRRILHAWGLTRSGAKIERHLDALIGAMSITKTVWDGVEFYWPDEVQPGQYAIYRVSENEADRRNAEDLPPEEIVNAIKEVLFTQVSLSLEDLIKETVRILGYARSGAALVKATRNGLLEAENRGIAEVSDGRVSYKIR